MTSGKKCSLNNHSCIKNETPARTGVLPTDTKRMKSNQYTDDSSMDILTPVASTSISNVGICTGTGQYQNSGYSKITLQGIRDLVDKPQEVDKAKAQWLITSTLMSRTFKEQECSGTYWYLWADLDENPPTINDLTSLLFTYLGCNYEVYTSRSATENYQKSRVIIPLSEALCGADWVLSQECLNDWLASHQIIPDRAAERAAQLCYLPNRGDYYASESQRDGDYFNPLKFFNAEIEKKRLAIEKSKYELIQKRELAKLKREQQEASGFESPIEEFNNSYPVEEILIQAGYDQHESKFRHPNSESGSYSSSVKNGRVHSLSSSDPLFSSDKGAHDAFSAFEVLFHQGDRNAALKDAGNNWLSINGESFNDVVQREYAVQKTKDDTVKLLGTTTDGKIAPFDFNKFSLNGDSVAMKAQMLTDTYVLGELAILGQLTAFYAKPNSGKTLLTLYLLIEAINAGNIKAEDVYYINADDNYKGLVHKLELAEKHGFQMIAPGFKDFDTASFGFYLAQLMATNEARGKVIILDTLKKFTNIMDKKLASDFGKQMRMFVTNGGTIIMLAHTNKNRDADGKVVFSGTSDIVDDVDCAYTLDVNDDKSGLTDKAVLFENIKSRGDVAQEAAYKYLAKPSHYQELLYSVSPIYRASTTLTG